MASKLTGEQLRQLAEFIRSHRLALGISASELARRAGLDTASVTKLELCQLPQPNPNTLTPIARALGVPAADIFAITKWLPKDELPTFIPYLRSKYDNLPAEAIQDVEQYFQRVAERHHISPIGPKPGEDE